MVAKKLSQYLIENKDAIKKEDIMVVKTRLPEVQSVLSKVVATNDLQQFINQQLELVRS